MDTKLKNRHKLGVGIIIFVIAAATFATLSLYPFIMKNADMANVSYYEYLYRSNFLTITTAIQMFVVSIAALLLPCFKSLSLGQEKIFRAPFGIVFAIASMGLLVVASIWIPLSLVVNTIDGYYVAEIQKYGISWDAAWALVWAFNGMLWAIGYAAVYWVVTCFRSIFTLGLRRYIKERTFIGILVCGLVHCFQRFYAALETVDLRKSPDKTIFKIILCNFAVLSLVCCFWIYGLLGLVIYSSALFFIIKKYWADMRTKYELLLGGFRQVAGGDFDTQIEENLGLFEPFRKELDAIQSGLKQAVDKAVQSQQMKTDLITNVSHDLKTPLTAIITYVNLLKEENITEEEQSSYIDILDKKAMHLKVLIEDLFEVSKASSNNITLSFEPVDMVQLMKQVRLELSDQISECGVDFRWILPEEKIILMLDGNKTYRIFENLLLNITKYALQGTRAYIEMKMVDEQLQISMRNISSHELLPDSEDLTERFVRGDESRNTEGSGLGLAIAKSFTEVQGGKLTVETEADLFRVIITWSVT